MSQPSGIVPEREIEWIKLSKDCYDEMVVQIRELKEKNKRLNNEIFELRKLDIETFFSWIRDRCHWTHDDQNYETIIRVPDKVLHDKFNGGVT